MTSRALHECPCSICVDRRAIEARALREAFAPRFGPVKFIIFDEASHITPEMVERIMGRKTGRNAQRGV